MEIRLLNPAAVIFFAGSWALATIAAAQPNAGLTKAKKDAEARGHVFFESHDELVSRAKSEGRLSVIVSLSEDALKPVNVAFRKKFPFIDTRVQGIRGTEVYLRLLQELKAGLTKNQDVNELVGDYYTEYLPYQKKFDILGMAQHKVLRIPTQMVDSINRNVVAIGNSIHVIAYNRKLIAPEKVPETWMDFLKPEFRDKKFIINIRPSDVQSLIPVWGLEKTLEFARGIAAQKPVWGRSGSAGLAQVLAGEHALLVGPHFDSVLRAKEKDKTDSLGYKLLEPIPIRLNEVHGILGTAEHPHAGLLWLEFLASPEGQKVLDEQGPNKGSAFVAGTVQEQAVRGKKLSVLDWSHFTKIPEYQKKITETYGFPRAEK